jgi:hypothetical protein
MQGLGEVVCYKRDVWVNVTNWRLVADGEGLAPGKQRGEPHVPAGVLWEVGDRRRRAELLARVDLSRPVC